MYNKIDSTMQVHIEELHNADKLLNNYILALVDGKIYKIALDRETIRAIVKAQEVVPEAIEYLNDYAKFYINGLLKIKQAHDESRKKVALTLVPK